MSRNNVKSVCQREDATPREENYDQGKCATCGGELEEGRRRRRFCSTACRMAWWHAHPERLDRKAIYTFTCAGCGSVFMVYGNNGRKYCSHPCYIRHRFNTRGGQP